MHQFPLYLLCPCVPLTFLGRLMDVFSSICKWIVIYAKIIYFCNISAKMSYSGWLVSTLLWNVHAHKILHRTFDILPTFICYHITITSYFKLVSTKCMYKQSCVVLRTWCFQRGRWSHKVCMKVCISSIAMFEFWSSCFRQLHEMGKKKNKFHKWTFWYFWYLHFKSLSLIKLRKTFCQYQVRASLICT